MICVEEKRMSCEKAIMHDRDDYLVTLAMTEGCSSHLLQSIEHQTSKIGFTCLQSQPAGNTKCRVKRECWPRNKRRVRALPYTQVCCHPSMLLVALDVLHLLACSLNDE